MLFPGLFNKANKHLIMIKVFVASCILLFLTVGCKEVSPITPGSLTNTKLTNSQLLTKHIWQLYETIQQVGNTQTQYKMNGINTTGSEYSRVRLVFKTDGTGSLLDALNNTYTLTWAFNSNDESKMIVVINYPVPATLKYEYISLDETSFTFTLYYSESGNQALATCKYVPV